MQPRGVSERGDDPRRGEPLCFLRSDGEADVAQQHDQEESRECAASDIEARPRTPE